MHYDPYESKDSKKRRIVSNIAIVAILAAMVAGIVFLLIPNNKQKKYDFSTLRTVELTAEDINGGECEFKSLIDTLSQSQHIIVADSFAASFPTGYSLLSLDGVAYKNSLAEYSDDIENLTNVPYVEVGGGYITIAQAVVSTEKDCRDLIIIRYEAEAIQADNAVSIKLGEYSCHTIRYNTRNPQIPLKLLVGEQSSTLDMYKIKFAVSGETPIFAQYSLTLNHAFDAKRAREELYHHFVFDPINESYGTAEIITNDKTTDIIMQQNKQALIKNENEIAYEIMLNDKSINLIDNINLKFEFDGNDNKLRIVLN